MEQVPIPARLPGASARAGNRASHARWLAGILPLLLALLVCAPVWAQGRSPHLCDYARDVWTTRNGLPQNTLRDIAQTPDGHLWLATWEGVARYNGLEFTVFDRSSSPALPDNGIGTLYVDAEGALWLGDSRGNVARYDARGNWQHWTPAAGDAPAIIIEAMQKDSQGRLWLMYEGAGLGQLDGNGRFHHYPPPAEFANSVNYTRMAVDAQDRVWLGTFDGLLYLDADGQMKRAPQRFNLPRGLAWPYRARDGAIWVVASDRIYRMEGEQLVLKHRLPGVGQLTAMMQDRRGDLWLGTENKGLWRLGAGGVEHLEAEGALLGSRVISLLEDAEGSIWVGLNGGLLRLRETLFSSYSHARGLSGDYVRTLIEDARGGLWVGSSSGLDRMLPDGRIEPVPLRTHERQPSIMSLAVDAGNAVWVGTRGEGVFHLRPQGAVRQYRPGIELPRGNYRSIVVGDDGTVWLGSSQGVLRMVNGQAQPVTAAGMPRSVVLGLQWNDGALWIGTIDGAWRLQGDVATRLDVAGVGGARAVYGFQPLDGAMWITTDRGLYRYRDGKLVAVGLAQGLPIDTVFELVPDRLGNAWLSSNRGVWRTRSEALTAVADGRQSRLSGEMYREIDGLVSSQSNGSSRPAAILRHDGTVWVATAGGLVTVDPDALVRFNAIKPPPAVVENVLLDGRPLNWRGNEEQQIPGGQRLSISYVGLSYLMPARIRYRTRLQGLDNDWVERGSQRGVEYVGLPPGRYALHVSAAHPDGQWSEGPALWHFTVQPMWWQRLEVRLAFAALTLLGLYLLYRFLIHRYRSSNARLTRLVDRRTYDLKLQAERLLAANSEKTALAERLRVQADLFEQQAREDGLTGLPNRRAFDDVLSRDIARSRRSGRPMCLLILDIDYFKRINDSLSHIVGDKVLCEVGDLMRRCSRESDMPARLGGEEFGLILNDTGLQEARIAAERLHQLFAEHRHWGGIEDSELTVSFSAGLVQLRDDDLTPSMLCHRADRALYQAKHEGRGRTCLG